eukprot:GHUV01017518.1.p1 GENE.GHUV01017518.1~~GHUV01017518.1.p1  ORF type:complete len:158 (+),score=37.70 GHUV01017518.1:176-649(+)
MLPLQMFFLALLAVSAAGQSAGMHSTGTGSKSLAALDSCVSNPLQTNCTSYEYPVAAAADDLSKLCGAMHFMSACSVAKACNASGAGPDDPTGPGAAKISSRNPDICQPFTQVATVCKLDPGMGRMSGAGLLTSQQSRPPAPPLASAKLHCSHQHTA